MTLDMIQTFAQAYPEYALACIVLVSAAIAKVMA